MAILTDKEKEEMITKTIFFLEDPQLIKEDNFYEHFENPEMYKKFTFSGEITEFPTPEIPSMEFYSKRHEEFGGNEVLNRFYSNSIKRGDDRIYWWYQVYPKESTNVRIVYRLLSNLQKELKFK